MINKGRTTTISQNIRASVLQKPEVMKANWVVKVCPAMKYPLCESTCIQENCMKINRSYLPAILSCMAFNRKAKRNLLLGPFSPLVGVYVLTDT